MKRNLSLMKTNLSLAFFAFLFVFSSLTILTGCSSVSESRQAAIPISARPAGSQLTVSCVEGASATTRSEALLPSGSESARCSITASHPGYEPATAIVTRVASAGRPSTSPISVVLTLEPERSGTAEGR